MKGDTRSLDFSSYRTLKGGEIYDGGGCSEGKRIRIAGYRGSGSLSLEK